MFPNREFQERIHSFLLPLMGSRKKHPSLPTDYEPLGSEPWQPYSLPLFPVPLLHYERPTTNWQSNTSLERLTSELEYEAPRKIRSKLTWKEAREVGMREGRWIMIDIQDYTTIKLHFMNRDIWNDMKILDVLREKFIFLQWRRKEYDASEYIGYYFPDHKLQSAYPHITIVDPKTCEQLRLWSGYVPKPTDFLSDLHAFLDRYGLNSRAEEQAGSMPMEAVEEDELDYQTSKTLENYKPTIQATSINSDIVGVLFKSCADLFWPMAKELCLLDSIEQKEKSLVRDTFVKFYFWGAGFQAEQGELDKILVSSASLKDQILSLLLKIAKILDTGDPPPLPPQT